MNRTERWAPSELQIIDRAAAVRGLESGAFIADAAVGVAIGRYGPVRRGHAQPVSAEEVATLRQLGLDMAKRRHLLANAANNLNQIAAAANSGNPATAKQLAAVLANVNRSITDHDAVVADLADLMGRFR